ncbi:MAG: ParA family protein [Chloroflexi bacterium]|nr:ParA family protein [Chloroflexota bacterium]MCI0731094.1 ParA family protein [Chloroflexota bacterium]
MAYVISFTIYKGGTGKTTSAVNTAAALSQLGQRVLLVDLDQQASSTRYVGLNPDEVNPTFYHVFMNQVPASVIRQETRFGFDVLPSSSLMAAIEESLEPGEERMLRTILQPLQEEYDYILIDTPPGKAALAFNGIVAADMLLVPASAERMSIDGVSDLVNHVQEIFWHKFREELRDQEIRVLFTMYKSSTKHSPGVVQASKRIYRENVLNVYVPETIEFPRSFEQRTPLTHLLPAHHGAQAYYRVAEWIITHARAKT